MKISTNPADLLRSTPRRLAPLLLIGLALLHVGCGMDTSVGPGRVQRPAAEDFGFGPRASASGIYQATLEPLEPVRIGRIQTMRLELRDAAGAGVAGATITVDGGMPEHGHGLPTRPRVTRDLGGGIYEIEGVKFNMGGWWVFRLRIEAAAGADLVEFNLDL